MEPCTDSKWDLGKNWHTAIAAYVTDGNVRAGADITTETVFSCLANKTHTQTLPAGKGAMNYAMPLFLSTHDYICWGGRPSGATNWRKIDSVRQASATIALLDYYPYCVLTGYGVTDEYYRPLAHNNRDNFLFLDVHVDLLQDREDLSGSCITNYDETP